MKPHSLLETVVIGVILFTILAIRAQRLCSCRWGIQCGFLIAHHYRGSHSRM